MTFSFSRSTIMLLFLFTQRYNFAAESQSIGELSTD
jgi:hypothetical protein